MSDEQVTKADLKEFGKEMIQAMDDRLRINNDLIRQEIKALDRKIDQTEERILTGVAELLEHNVSPQIEDLDRRVTKLEVKTVGL